MKALYPSIVLALVFVATACKTANRGDSEDSSSSVNDFGGVPNPSSPQQVQTFVPQGGSTTALLQLSAPFTSNKVRVGTNCNLQLAQLIIRNQFGQVGHLAQSAGQPTVWFAASGAAHTITHVQFVTNNFGAAQFCTLSIAPESDSPSQQPDEGDGTLFGGGPGVAIMPSQE